MRIVVNILKVLEVAQQHFMRDLDHSKHAGGVVQVFLLENTDFFFFLIIIIKKKKKIQAKENPISIQSITTKKYFMSLKTAISIRIIKANPENERK